MTRPLGRSDGRQLVMVAVVLQIIGTLIISRLVDIEY